jgi:membrane-associated protease RseP (regulator of RpoE activity)
MQTRRRDVIFLLLSVFIHLSVLATFMKRAKHQDTIEIELMPAGSHSKGDKIKDNEKILDKVNAEKPAVKKPKKGFWGIGVDIYPYAQLALTEKGPLYGWRLLKIHSGYPADELGLRPGDIIVTVDGQPISASNDVRGDGPSVVTVEVFRDGRLMMFTVNRGFIDEE